jgi:hypothetical protein
MSFQVTVQVEVCVEFFRTMGALEPLLTLMDFIVLVEVGFLCETIITIRMGTTVRPLTSVDS